MGWGSLYGAEGRVMEMRYQVGSEYMVTKEMEAKLEEDPHDKNISPPIPVGSRLLIIKPLDDKTYVRFSFEVRNYWTFRSKFAECTKKRESTGGLG
jgi:hypothetical protein